MKRSFVIALTIIGSLFIHAADAPTPPRFSVQHMDRSADPKNDFARFAFGNWVKTHPIPADKATWGGFPELRQFNWNALKSVLEETSAAKNKAGSVEQKVGDFYLSALDTNAINEAGLKPIRAELRKIDSIKSQKDLARAIAHFHDNGVPALFRVSINADRKNSSTNALNIWQGGLSLPGGRPSRDYYFKPEFEKIRTAFLEHVTKMFVLAGADPDKAAADARTVFEVEKSLAGVSKTPTELRDALANYHKMSLAEWQAKFPAFPVSIYLSERKLKPAQVIVGQPKFFEGLQSELQKRPLSDWKTYLGYQLLRDSAPHLAAAFEQEHFRFFNTVVAGTPEMEPRWQRAAQVIDGNLGEALGQLYVARFYPPEARARMDELIRNVRAVMTDRLKKLEWMSEPTRQKAGAKFERFVARIGHPEKWRDYSSVKIRRDDYFGNIRRAVQFEVARDKKKFGQPVDKSEWRMTPPTVNAYFSGTENQIVFPAGILQPPFFDFTLDDAVNYGAIGAVIGHEITHGFDDQGRRFDAEGNLNDWWTPEDAEKFQARAKVVIDQFNAYEPLSGAHVNGELTLGENIADLGGISIAYEAFQRSLKGKERKTIDGFTPEQRFFLSWAQQWRTNMRDDALRRLLNTDPHSPGMVRAFAPLTNMQEFFDAFGIKEGDKMFRADKDRAKIW